MIMKNNYVLFLFLGLFFSSCIREYETITEFKITNLTKNQIDIFVSNFETRYYNTLDTTFSIQPESSIDFYYSNKGENAPFLHPFGIESDALIIFFNDTIGKLYAKGDGKNRNPLDIKNFINVQKDDEYYLFEYSITDEDLQEAIEN